MAEGIPPRAIRVTGNPVVSAIARYSGVTPRPAGAPPTVVVTLHRRELTTRRDFPEIARAVIVAMGDAASIKFVWVQHPRLGDLRLPKPANVTLAQPLAYRVMLHLVAGSQAVLTDSGGLIEEATTLGVPSVTFRNVTDRPEAVEAGLSVVCPPSVESAREAVASAADPSWAPREPSRCFGDVDAASQIAQAILGFAGTE